MLESAKALRTQLFRREVRHLNHDKNADRAAVAVVFRQGTDGLELLFIRRSEHELDPWSGQIAFPGGRADEGDKDLIDTARREAFEEVGLDLGPEGGAALLGELDALQARARARPLSLIIHPVAWLWTGQEKPPLRPSPEEVSEAFWVPLDELCRRGRQGGFEETYGGVRFFFPTIEFGDQGRLWGLTLRMVGEVLLRLGRIEDLDALSMPRPLS